MRNYSALSPEWKNKVVLKSIEYLTGHKAVKWHTEANRYAYKIESDLQYYFTQPGSGKVNGWRVVLQSDIDFVLKNHIGSILTQLDYKF